MDCFNIIGLESLGDEKKQQQQEGNKNNSNKVNGLE